MGGGGGGGVGWIWEWMDAPITQPPAAQFFGCI
nr:MAG TPA: hypothetical protein [Caudoviricetes sp.]